MAKMSNFEIGYRDYNKGMPIPMEPDNRSYMDGWQSAIDDQQVEDVIEDMYEEIDA